MRIAEAVELMTKQYLQRVLESFTKDIGPVDEEQARDIILRNADELARPEHVDRRLDLFKVSHSDRVLVHFVLETILNTLDCMLTERELTERVRDRESKLIEDAQSDDALQYVDARNVEIFRAVLEVAFEDDVLSEDEYRLVRRLRQKLNLTRKQQWIVEAQLDAFPKPGRNLHTPTDVRHAVRYLERNGILFWCNQADAGPVIVLPDELQQGVKATLDIELSEAAKRLLWDNLVTSQLQEILKAHGLPIYGTKEEKVQRLLSAEVVPSQGLHSLSNDDLYKICNRLPGVLVSGTKQDKVVRIIDHFDKLLIREISEEAPPGQIYYEYFTELAGRDRQNLLANKVIKKDIDIERAFEEATRYLFQTRLGLELLQFAGSEHADGGVATADGTLLLWDNKSSEEPYRFPNSHLRQFKRYIRDTRDASVSCFMIVVPEVHPEAEDNCIRLKFESNQETDVCIIRAEDLKWVAEAWRDVTDKGQFNPAVFDQNGILDRRKLEQLMRVLL